MLLRAAREWSISLASSIVIGDSLSDIKAGKAVGADTVLTNPWEQDAAETTADFTCATIGDAIDWALRRMREPDRR
jgi:histidinol phosphatase-like enzyme